VNSYRQASDSHEEIKEAEIEFKQLCEASDSSITL